MKRSEMVKNIWDYMNRTYSHTDKGGFTKWECIQILDVIENAGMYPPTQMVGEIPVVFERAYTKWHPKNEWESEE